MITFSIRDSSFNIRWRRTAKISGTKCMYMYTSFFLFLKWHSPFLSKIWLIVKSSSYKGKVYFMYIWSLVIFFHSICGAICGSTLAAFLLHSTYTLTYWWSDVFPIQSSAIVQLLIVCDRFLETNKWSIYYFPFSP